MIGGMQITTSAKVLAKHLQRAQGVAKKTTTMPILASVLLQTGKGVVNITASNIEVESKDAFTAAIGCQGNVAIEAKMFHDVIKNLSGDVKLDVLENNWLSVECGRSKFKLLAQRADSFPVFSSSDESTTLKLRASEVVDAINRVGHAMMVTDMTRPNLRSLHIEDGTAVTTDGHRLAIAKLAGEWGTKPITFPVEGVIEMKRLLADAGDAEIELALGTSHVRVRYGTSCLSMQLLADKFPDWRQVVPATDTFKGTVVVGRSALQSALVRVGSVITDSKGAVALSFDPKGILRIAGNELSRGQVSEEIDATITGSLSKLSVGVSHHYLEDAVGAIDAETIELAFVDTLSPMRVAAAGNAEAHFAIVMPCRL